MFAPLLLTAIFPACWLMTWLYEYQLTRSSGQNHNSSRGKKKKEKDLLLAYHHISCLAYPHLHSCCRICGKNWMPLLYTSTPLLPVIPLLGQAGRQKPQNGCNTIVELWHIFSFKKKKKKETNSKLYVLVAGKLLLFIYFCNTESYICTFSC